MIETIENIYYFLGFFLPYSFGTAFIGFIILFVIGWLDKSNIKLKKIKRIGIILFAQLFVLGLLVFFIKISLSYAIRVETLKLLNDTTTLLTQKNTTFGVFSSEQLKNELSKVNSYNPHNSSPDKEMIIHVTSKKGSFNIIVAQDCFIEDEFWIFSDKYEFSKDFEMGRITTRSFKLEN